MVDDILRARQARLLLGRVDRGPEANSAVPFSLRGAPPPYQEGRDIGVEGATGRLCHSAGMMNVPVLPCPPIP